MSRFTNLDIIRGRRRKEPWGCGGVLAILLGGALFFLMEHPVLFFAVFVPLIILLVAFIVKFCNPRNWKISDFLMIWIILLIIIIVIVITVSYDQCEHEDTATMYTFAHYDSSQYSDVRPCCRDCGKRFQYKLFKGELADQSYLGAIVEHSDGSEILKGEYYTVTAVAPIGYYGYGDERVMLTCEVENNEYIVRFTAEFREEFRGAVSSVEEGDTITFRGRFYDKGCGFTDCELITE